MNVDVSTVVEPTRIVRRPPAQLAMLIKAARGDTRPGLVVVDRAAATTTTTSSGGGGGGGAGSSSSNSSSRSSGRAIKTTQVVELRFRCENFS
jgi:hypothetical protein